MANRQINNWNDLQIVLQQVVAEAMEETVSKDIKKMESENVKEFVCSAYDPTVYERRMNNGGLSDVNNMSHTINSNGNSVELTVENNTMSNNEFLPINEYPHKIANEVEFGYGYNYMNMEERAFQRETINELKYGKAKTLLLKGLKKKGIKAK